MLTHHAYLLEDSTSLFDAYANSIRATEGFDAHSPDFFAQKYEKFGIDEARELTQKASLKSTTDRALYILGISSITTEAQQALLKLFEEPQEGLVFVVIAPPGLFIPTLRSRFIGYPYSFTERSTDSLQDKRGRSSALRSATEFLASTYSKRSTVVTELLENEEDTKERVRDFLQSLEVCLYEKLSGTDEKAKKHVRAGLEDIATFRSYVQDRAPSLKMILEHLALTLPKI